MATIVDTDHTLNVSELGKALAVDLPHYAMPIFLRVAKKIDMTSKCHYHLLENVINLIISAATFKLKKFNLQKEGYDPSNVGSDHIFFRKNKNGDFVELTTDLYKDIVAGKVQC
jgi:solute carrier family 27 (fatty acid transporter), member 1/4